MCLVMGRFYLGFWQAAKALRIAVWLAHYLAIELAGYVSAFEKVAGDAWCWNKHKRFRPRNWSG